MSEWKETTLGEISLKITDGAHHSPKEFDCGKPMFSVKNMRDQGFDYNGVKTISDEDFVKLVNSGCQPQKDDILIAKDGSVMKHVFRVKGAIDYVLLSSIAIVRPDKSKVNPSYLVYAIKDPSTTDLILNNFVGGSGVPRIVLKDFKKVDLTIPSLDTQKSIASILSSLDDKIDLLHRQNVTLEKMAETLFRQWFVEEAKDDWEMGTFGQFITETVGGEWGKESIDGDYSKAVNCIRGTDIADLNIGLPTRTPVRFVKEKKFQAIYPNEGDLIIEISGGTENQSTGRTCYINSQVRKLFSYPLVFSNFCRMIRVKDPMYSYFLYCYFQFLYNQDEFFSLENGSSGIKNLDYKTLLFEFEYIMPDTNTIIDFHKKVELIFSKVNHNKNQILTLTALRDTLLPKLMSGEVRVVQD